MKALRLHLDDYLRLRRQLGYKIEEIGFLLRNFVRFAEQEGASFISTKLALRWAAGPNITPGQSGNRLGMVRRFAEYVSAHDARTEVPAQKLLPYHFVRRDPYHYTDENVVQLTKAARQIAPSDKIKGPTLATLFGLLAVTGMRVGEALALECKDVDFNRELLTICQAKGNKSRLVPLHPSTVSALREYAFLRDNVYPRRTHAGFFAWERGGPLIYEYLTCATKELASPHVKDGWPNLLSLAQIMRRDLVKKKSTNDLCLVFRTKITAMTFHSEIMVPIMPSRKGKKGGDCFDLGRISPSARHYPALQKIPKLTK